MKKIIGYLQIGLLIAVIFYSQFHNLQRLPIRIWDEARLATNAYEVAKYGHWLLPSVDLKPDMWNTKPPLMVWSQAVLIKLIGVNELSVRLPAAICAALTTLLVAFFVYQISRNGWAALLSGIVLSTSIGYIGPHGTRFGEYEGMLAFFTTCYVLAFFMYTESNGPLRNKYLGLFFVSLTCAALTKGIAGLLFTPSLFIYVLFRRQLVNTLANKYLYLGIGGFLVFVAGYYLLREHYNPGYLAVVSENELGGRFSEVNEAHSGNWDFYWELLKKEHFGTWYWALPASLFFIWFLPGRKVHRALVFCVLCAFCFMTVIAISKTKILWYDLPAYPLFACIIAFVVLQFANILSAFKYVNRQFAMVVLVTVFSIQPVYEAFNFIKWQLDDLSRDQFYAISYYLRDAVQGRRTLKDDIYFFNGYCIQSRLYAKRLSDMGTGVDDRELVGGNKFNVGQKIILNQDEVENFIKGNYEYKILDEFYGVKHIELTGIKDKAK